MTFLENLEGKIKNFRVDGPKWPIVQGMRWMGSEDIVSMEMYGYEVNSEFSLVLTFDHVAVLHDHVASMRYRNCKEASAARSSPKLS